MNNNNYNKKKSVDNFSILLFLILGIILLVILTVVYTLTNSSKNKSGSSDTEPDSFEEATESVESDTANDGLDSDTEGNTEDSTSVPNNYDTYSVTSKGYKIDNVDGCYYVEYNSNRIMVINKTYSISENYNPGDLTAETNKAFDALVSAAADEGLNIYLASGFRSFEYQKTVYQKWVNRYGQEYADTISAKPGHSEHQSGLAIDVNVLDESFGDTEEGRWLASNCSKFGFILRYSKGKEDITGYAYEPWHIRYVGDVAKEIAESGLCLEEFLGIDSVYD